ncbi:MAG: hydrogenase small subunit [Acidobacteriota bacterium]
MNARKSTSARDIPSPPGVSRRSFLKFCTAVAVTIGLGPTGMAEVARALTGPKPIVVWLNFSECTGCTESLLRMSSPTPDSLILDTISLEYHETLMAAAGLAATGHLTDVVNANAGQFFAIVEGSIPTANNGAFGTIGGETMLAIAQRVLPKAKAVIAYGTCSSYGGLAAAAPNPTGAKGVKDLGILGSVPLVNVPGCSPNPYNLAGVLTTYLLKGTLPALDSNLRPTFAFGQTVHSRCPKPHGCLEDYKCKGKSTYNNCATAKFNGGTSWDIQAVHHCIGCSNPNFWDANSPFYDSSFGTKFASSSHSKIQTVAAGD